MCKHFLQKKVKISFGEKTRHSVKKIGLCDFKYFLRLNLLLSAEIILPVTDRETTTVECKLSPTTCEGSMQYWN